MAEARHAKADIPRTYADFNNADLEGRLRLTVAGARSDLLRLANEPQPGTPAVFYSEELEVEGTIERSDSEDGILVGRIDWSEVRELGD